MKKFIYCIFTLAMFSLLQSCMVSAATTSAQVVYDRKHIDDSLEDNHISFTADEELFLKRKQFSDSHLSIATFHRVVLMTGQVSSERLQKEAENIVRSIPDVKTIYNMTRVGESTSGFTQAQDVWITTKIKTQMIASNDFYPGQVKVVTEDGVVYLMGILPPDQAEIAVDIARQTSGVTSVVKIFKYLVVRQKTGDDS